MESGKWRVENGEWSMRHVQNGSSNWNAAASATMGNFHFNFRSFARPPSHCDICNIFCSFAAFGDALRVLFSSLFFFFFVGFGLAKNFCLLKEKTFTRNVLWHEAGQGREGGTYWAFWHSLATVFGGSCVCVCVGKNFSYVNNSMRDGQGKRCQRAANY